MNKKIHNPHDRLFRASMQYPEVAKEFLAMHLPAELYSKLDLKSLVICPNSFIDEELKLLQSDVLLKVLVAGHETYFYILAEHQKKPEKLMPFRLVKYMMRIWDMHFKETEKDSLPMPVIFPLVFFTGSGEYNTARAIWELCGDQAEIMQQIWCSMFALIDVNHIPEEALTSRRWAGTVEFIMRNRFRQHLTHELNKIASNINFIGHAKSGQLVLELLTYIMNIDDEHRTIQELTSIMHNQLSPEVESDIMTLAERLREEGAYKQQLKIAQRMLEKGADEIFVAEVTKLPLTRIKALQKKDHH